MVIFLCSKGLGSRINLLSRTNRWVAHFVARAASTHWVSRSAIFAKAKKHYRVSRSARTQRAAIWGFSCSPALGACHPALFPFPCEHLDHAPPRSLQSHQDHQTDPETKWVTLRRWLPGCYRTSQGCHTLDPICCSAIAILGAARFPAKLAMALPDFLGAATFQANMGVSPQSSTIASAARFPPARARVAPTEQRACCDSALAPHAGASMDHW